MPAECQSPARQQLNGGPQGTHQQAETASLHGRAALTHVSCDGYGIAGSDGLREVCLSARVG
jgi:hypothetical protein